MDLVFKRYSNPFFLDLCIENNELSDFFDTLIEQLDEEKMWELYLATVVYNDKTFSEWKDEIYKNNTKSKSQYKRMTKKEIDATIKKSETILKSFKPPQEGGFYKC